MRANFFLKSKIDDYFVFSLSRFFPAVDSPFQRFQALVTKKTLRKFLESCSTKHC